MKINFARLIAAVLICEAAGVLGSVFTETGAGSWYSQLIKPEFNPPNWVFAPVWTLLYLLMAASIYILWEKKGSAGANHAIASFSLQLFLNFLWSFLFFGLQSPLLGLVCIAFLWAAIIATIYYSWRVSRPAALLLIPYILWVSFAAVLNYSLFALNP